MTTNSYDPTGKRIWVAGRRYMVGSAVMRHLETEDIAAAMGATSEEVDLRPHDETEAFVERTNSDVVILAAALVGGIHANRSAQAEFLYDNLMITTNTLLAAGSTV